MSNPIIQLQGKIFENLKDDSALTGLLAGGAIYDYAPDVANFPYISFGRTSVFDWSTSTERGSEHIISLHIWSRGKGKKQAATIMARVEDNLSDFNPAISGHHVVCFRLEFSEVRFDDEAYLHHGIMRYRAHIDEE